MDLEQLDDADRVCIDNLARRGAWDEVKAHLSVAPVNFARHARLELRKMVCGECACVCENINSDFRKIKLKFKDSFMSPPKKKNKKRRSKERKPTRHDLLAPQNEIANDIAESAKLFVLRERERER